ncbi:related to Rotein of unknown function localised to mitochondria [Cephalotrichum gorgonifer]|uniref:Autophagy-related protein 33 n=1 Tax=Cephalotrichum gorgonifer TaxID=2041049 RepID=A0AAE8SR38_9PEZI|nr:related to Rotein of unknown function localised to mitochondria [Cephalotrichum gorgonifer]
MSTKKVSALKFVGTVSVGLLTGVSYTLSNISAPAILTLPSASSATKALSALSAAASSRLTTLSAVSSSAFALAFILSPRSSRHPYLLYTSVLSALASFAPRIAPLLLGPAARSAPVRASPAPSPKKKKTPRSMEASYEVLGDLQSEEASVASEEAEEEPPATPTTTASERQNEEEVRAQVEDFVKARLVQTGLAAVGFAISVLGIWGDGVQRVLQSETVVFGM